MSVHDDVFCYKRSGIGHVVHVILPIHWEGNDRWAVIRVFQVRELSELRHIDRRFEYHEYMCFIMCIERLAVPTQVLRAICTPEPGTTDALHATVTECGGMYKEGQVFFGIYVRGETTDRTSGNFVKLG